MRFSGRLFAAGLLAAGVVAAVPAAAANASASVTVEWVSDIGAYTHTFSCSGTATHQQSGLSWYVTYVSNGCGDRVWLHGTIGGGGATYCVNPGAIAYGFSGDFQQVELGTANGAACDAGAEFKVVWVTQTPFEESYPCVDGYTATADAYVLDVQNSCNTRIWIHANPDGSGGAVACISPGGTWGGPEGTQVQVTANQAPCSAG
jgi:hypothetical protein